MFDNTLLEIVLNSVEFEILKSMGNTLGMELSVGHYGLGFFFFFNFFFYCGLVDKILVSIIIVIVLVLGITFVSIFFVFCDNLSVRTNVAWIRTLQQLLLIS